MPNLDARDTREARLRPESAPAFPSIVPDAWEPAAQMADRVADWLIARDKDGHLFTDRVLTAEHFEFRDRPPRLAEARTERRPAGTQRGERAEEMSDRVHATALSLGAERAVLYEAVGRGGLIIRLYLGERSALIECSDTEVAQLLTDTSVESVVRERMRTELRTLGSPEASA